MQSANIPAIRALILDMDGVLWRGDQPIGSLPYIFSTLENHGYKVILATNNATLSAEQYLEKLRRFDVVLERWQIVNSSQATAQYLHQIYPEGGAVYIIGEEGLVCDLKEQGFYLSERDVLAVVVGLDRSLTYEKLAKGALLINSGARFIGTNPDRSLPTPDGLLPGAGAIITTLEVSTGVKPIIIGKPAPELYQLAIGRLATSPIETLVVGDRLETDIAGGQALGCPTALVLSGATSKQDAVKWEPPPHLIVDDLTSLLDYL
jgi:HAD superfamily hydrolase (TIGR01457 family)